MWKISSGHSKDAESRFYKEMTRSERAAAWVTDGYISIGFGDVTDELYGTSWEVVKQAGLAKGRSVSEASSLNIFLNTMKPGDLVVFRTARIRTTAGKIWIGRVGTYYRVTTDHLHRRHVQWLASLKRDQDDEDMEDATFLRPTVVSVTDKSQKSGVNFYSTIVDRFALHDELTASRRPLGRIAELLRADYVLGDSRLIPGAPEATVSAINLHNETQNALLIWLRSRFGTDSVQTFDRALGWKAEVDLLLEEDERITIIEVKSIQDGNDLIQLRDGLAQTLDYMDRYRTDGRDVHGLLWLSSEPEDSARWQQLCNRCRIRLGWPGIEDDTFER